ncbi:MAG: hypothetical protein ACKOCQ_06315, partial [Candidatus Nitrosotenuis sp.]
DKLAPSLMIPTTHQNPSLIKIMPVDVQKVRSIYGSQGFYAFSDLVPLPPEKPTPTPLPTPRPEPPLQPVSPFKYLKITESQIIIEKYDSKTARIQGQIDEQIFHKGHPVYILIIKPDYTTEVHRLPVTGTGYFEIPIKFDSTDLYGTYSVEGSYMEYTDQRTNFEFSIIHDMYEKYDTPSKNPTKIVEQKNPTKTADKNPDKKETPKKEAKKEIKTKKEPYKETKKTVKKDKESKTVKKEAKNSKTIKVSRGQTTYEKISGSMQMESYQQGKQADVSIIKPDGTIEMQKINISNKGKFEHVFSITDRTTPGKYEITISYSGMTIKKFTYEIRN